MVSPSPGPARPARKAGARPGRNHNAAGPRPWMRDAACAGADPELFFPQDRRDPRAGEARRTCARCPARADCLEYSLSTGQEHGTWGGVDEWERRDLLDARRRQRQQDAGPQDVA